MHPQFSESRIIRKQDLQKILACYLGTNLFCTDCGQLIQALEECHQQGFIHRAFGSCNNQKEELTKCLHEERVLRERQNMLKSIEKRKQVAKRWKEMDEEEYGPGGYLRQVAQRKE